jgi:thiamine biosynthesis lipoprotein
VTIVCKSGILSDALSTACFVLGIEEGMALAEDYGAEVLFVDKDGKIEMSRGMKAVFHAS